MEAGAEKETEPHERRIVAYVAPTVLFLVMTTIEGFLPRWYVGLYIAKAALVTGCLLYYRGDSLRDYRPEWKILVPAALAGVLIFLIWIPLDRMTPFHPALGGRAAFNPFLRISNPELRATFLAIRFYGLVLLVPVIEELFWRSFLLRYLSASDGNFTSMPIGTFTWGAFGLVAVLFAASHPEWLSALVCAIVYGLLLRQTRSLFATLIAHSLTNLLLGLQILSTHNWKYW